MLFLPILTNFKELVLVENERMDSFSYITQKMMFMLWAFYHYFALSLGQWNISQNDKLVLIET